QETTWIGGDNRLGLGGEQLLNFAVAKLTGWLWIQKVVDARGATAQVGLFDLDDFEAGNGGEDPARLLVNGLSMAKMAGVVVGDAHGQGMARSLGGQIAKDLGDVLALCAEGCGAGGPDGIVAEDVAILFHGRATPGSVDH